MLRRGYSSQRDLSDLKPYRNYIAITDVEPAGYRFDVSYDRGVLSRAWTYRAPDGTTFMVRARERGPDEPGLPVPAAIASLAKELEATLRERCGPGELFAYTGTQRNVTVTEIVVDSRHHGTQRRGWQVGYTVPMDASLTRIVGQVTERYRSIHPAAYAPPIDTSAQWIPSPSFDPMAPVFTGDAPKKLERLIAQAAQRFDARDAPPRVASLIPEPTPMLPPGFVSRVRVRVIFYPRGSSSAVTMIAPIELHDAVFGTGATAAVEMDHYKLRATLTPRGRREPTEDPRRDLYHGTLTLRLEDGAANTWIRRVKVKGLIDIEGDTAIALEHLQVGSRDEYHESSLPGAYRAVRIAVLGGILDPRFDPPIL